MFNRGITQLLEALPAFEALDEREVRRVLSLAYADALDLAQEGPEPNGMPEELARLALGLESHAVLSPSASAETVRACAFVAAEALSLGNQIESQTAPSTTLARLDPARYRWLEAGLLYLIAGYDSNAAVVAREVRGRRLTDEARGGARYAALHAEDAVAQIRSVLRLGRPPSIRERTEPPRISTPLRLRAVLWKRLAAAARSHLLWLRLEEDLAESPAPAAISEFLEPLVAERAAEYSDIALLARLLAMACDASGGRALRSVPGPEDEGGFSAYLVGRAQERPLMWPATQHYSDRCLQGDAWHAAVAVPTGAGKSGVAELGIAHELHRGWILYLAPTNALVAQVQRDLRLALAAYPEVSVQGFLGGPELTGAAEEAIDEIAGRSVLVMTPEKCTLALRQAPDTFERLAMCILDECHLIGERGTRGVLAELVIAHVLTLAPEARVLLLSALVANPEDLAAWLQTVTGERAEPIREPWRPTRTLRSVLGFDSIRLRPRLEAADEIRIEKGRRRELFSAPAALLAGLQGAWDRTESGDFALLATEMAVPLSALERGFYYSSNDALAAAAEALAHQEHKVLAFIPGNRHWPFSVAGRVVVSTLTEELDSEVEHQLILAEHELGLPSKAGEFLRRGVGIHTSAMLDSERRACELAFVRGAVPVMLATGTMAQGLNLPATAVVIGGTRVGHEPGVSYAEQRERAKLQLLNAVGRAGRPNYAARSLAVVVPERPLVFDDSGSTDGALDQIPFLREEDAASPVHSRLVTLIDRALREDTGTSDMTIEELAAFAVLPLDNPDIEAGEVVRRTYGAWERHASNRESAGVIAGSLSRLGERFLGERPRWLAEAAYLAGLTVEQTLALHDGFLSVEFDDEDVAEWIDATLLALEDMSLAPLGGLLGSEAFTSTRCRALVDPNASDDSKRQAWEVLRETAALWLSGETYEEMGAMLVGESARGSSERHQRASLPRVIRLSNDVFGFGLTRAVGGLVAIHKVGLAAGDAGWARSPLAAQTLDLAPLAIRRGCGDLSSLAWSRFGRLPRRLAHLVSRHLPLSDDASDDEASMWVAFHRERLLDEGDFESWGLDSSDLEALEAWRQTVARD